jgi:proteasome assembly chaperone (PAC2) family protein
MEAINLYKEPKLRNPYMVAAWPGMGGVAIIAARYLIEKWDAKELGSIDPGSFFDLSGVLIEDTIVKDIQFPEIKFYLSRRRGRRDWIIFVGDAQPLMNGYRLANLVIDVAEKFGVKKLYTFAAAPTHIYHTKKPRVLAVANLPKLLPQLDKFDVAPLKQGSISGLNGLLLGAAKQRNMAGICLLGEIPIYTTHIANPQSAKAVLQVLAQMSNLEIDLTDIDKWAKETGEEIEEKINNLKQFFGEEAKELIDYFSRLADQTSEEDLWSEYKTEELLKEVERFLKDKGEQKGGN